MKPIKLTMSAFGPYAREQVIDFEKLGKGGVYLITGDTGAGKTTVFDGIAFALYGEPSGSARQPSMLRSRYADDATPTFVQLVFEYKGKTYDVKRNPEYKIQTRKTAIAQNAELLMPDGSVITKKKEVNEKITEILGVTKEQFMQISMIAQGDFQRFLFASTDERVEIFRSLFKTDMYESLAAKLSGMAKELWIKRTEHKNSISQYVSQISFDDSTPLGLELINAKAESADISGSLKVFERVINEDKEKCGEIKKAHDECKKRSDKLTADITAAESRIKTKNQLEKAKAELERLTPESRELSDAYQTELARQDETKVLSDRIATLNSGLKSYDELEQYLKQISDTQGRIKAAKSSIESIVNRKADIEKRILKIDEELPLVQNGEVEKQRLSAKAQIFADKEQSVAKIKSLYNECSSLRKSADAIIADYTAAQNAFNTADSEYQNASLLFLSEQAGILAEKLEDGMPCPVCGSPSHPSPARKSLSAPTQEQLKRYEASRSEKNKLMMKASELAAVRTSELKAKKESFFESVREYFGDISQSDIKTALESELAKLADEKKALREQLAAEERKIERKAQLEKERLSAAEEKESISRLYEENNSSLSALDATLKEQNAAYSKLYDSVSPKTRAEALQLIAALERDYKERISAFENARLKLEECSRRIEGAKKSISDLTELLKNSGDFEDVDIQSLADEKAKLNAEISRLLDEHSRLSGRLSGNENAYEGIVGRSRELEAVEARYRDVEELSSLANGRVSGKEKIALETFVQMRYFDRVVRHANHRLHIMTNGQYELVRSESIENKQKQAGLDLDIIDHNNSSRRSVRTLSGGESFKASLCLALGLSDEIQSRAGGVSLDSMFVDEGFGSLDEESLELTMNALLSHSGSDRLVGIISHVSELKTKIDKQIVITKSRENGSAARIITA